MRVFLNGEDKQLDPPQTVASLLLATGYGDRRVAVEVNREIVPKSAHAVRILAEGDCIEIIQAIGGG